MLEHNILQKLNNECLIDFNFLWAAKTLNKYNDLRDIFCKEYVTENISRKC